MKDDEKLVLHWLAGDDTGSSSESLAFEFLGIEGRVSVPYDPSDLGRCLRLIAKVPAVRACVDTLAAKHQSWARIAPHWDELARLMADEVGIDWSKGRSARLTYAAMLKAREASHD